MVEKSRTCFSLFSLKWSYEYVRWDMPNKSIKKLNLRKVEVEFNKA